MFSGLNRQTKVGIVVLIFLALLLSLVNIITLASSAADTTVAIAILNIGKDILTLFIILGLVKTNLLLLLERQEIFTLLSPKKKSSS